MMSFIGWSEEKKYDYMVGVLHSMSLTSNDAKPQDALRRVRDMLEELTRRELQPSDITFLREALDNHDLSQSRLVIDGALLVSGLFNRLQQIESQTILHGTTWGWQNIVGKQMGPDRLCSLDDMLAKQRRTNISRSCDARLMTVSTEAMRLKREGKLDAAARASIRQRAACEIEHAATRGSDVSFLSMIGLLNAGCWNTPEEDGDRSGGTR